MEEKVIKRIQELTEELESIITKREQRIHELRAIELRIKELASAIIELKKLLDKP